MLSEAAALFVVATAAWCHSAAVCLPAADGLSDSAAVRHPPDGLSGSDIVRRLPAGLSDTAQMLPALSSFGG